MTSKFGNTRILWSCAYHFVNWKGQYEATSAKDKDVYLSVYVSTSNATSLLGSLNWFLALLFVSIHYCSMLKPNVFSIMYLRFLDNCLDISNGNRIYIHLLNIVWNVLANSVLTDCSTFIRLLVIRYFHEIFCTSQWQFIRSLSYCVFHIIFALLSHYNFI